MSPQTAAKFTTISDSLLEAALALRRILPMQSGTRAQSSRWSPSQGATPVLAQLVEDPWTTPVPGDIPLKNGFSPMGKTFSLGEGPGEVPSTMCSPIRQIGPVGGAPGGGFAADGAFQSTMQRLIQENAALREAFNDANKRLSRLEDEKLRFFDEGIFDFVNSVCGKQPNAAMPLKNYEPSVMASMASPRSAVSSRRCEEERRSAELSGENEKLRRELERAGDLGEALEEQQHAAEDRMHSLEQEQQWLAERFANFANGGLGAHAGSTPGAGLGASIEMSRSIDASCVHRLDAYDSDSSGAGAATTLAAERDRRAMLEDMNRVLHAEIEEAGRQREELLRSEEHCRIESEALVERIGVYAPLRGPGHQPEMPDHIMLDGQTQALARHQLSEIGACTEPAAEDGARHRADPVPDGVAALETTQSTASELGLEPETYGAVHAIEPIELDEAW